MRAESSSESEANANVLSLTRVVDVLKKFLARNALAVANDSGQMLVFNIHAMKFAAFAAKLES